jgi:hypothetical protein
VVPVKEKPVVVVSHASSIPFQQESSSESNKAAREV